MNRGIYSQGVVVLLKEPLEFSQIEGCLSGFQVLSVESAPNGAGQPHLVLKDDTAEGGQVTVMLSDQPWPDEMGDPEESPELFMAWTLGEYGPLTFPGGLERAGEQSWRWDEGRSIASQHTAHVRVLYRYEFEDGDDQTLSIPDTADPVTELHFVTRVISRLLELPAAIATFNPAGEVLMNAEDLREGMNDCWRHEIVPVDMWTNVRLFRAGEDWTLMDTIGNEQFDLPDLEMIFENEQFDPSDIESFLRNVVLCLLMDDIEISDGDTADGPGEQDWCALLCPDGLNDPPRPTIRWYPVSASPPEDLLDPGEAPEPDSELDSQADGEELCDDEEE